MSILVLVGIQNLLAKELPVKNTKRLTTIPAWGGSAISFPRIQGAECMRQSLFRLAKNADSSLIGKRINY